MLPKNRWMDLDGLDDARWCPPPQKKWIIITYNPTNQFDISTINHSEMGLINQLNANKLGHHLVDTPIQVDNDDDYG